MPSNATRQRKKQKRKDVFSASRFNQDESLEEESASSSGMEEKRVRFRRSRLSPRRPTPSLSTRLQPFAILFALLSIGIILATFPLTLPRFSYIVQITKSFFNEFPPVVLFSPPQPTRRIPLHVAEYVNRAIIAALKSTAERPDFASQGAIVVPSLTIPYDELDDIPSHNPDNVLTADLDRESCWFFPDSRGQVAIRVPQLIHLTHITIDYFPPQQTMAHHAPRRVVLWGLIDGAANKALYTGRLKTYREAYRRLGDGPAHEGAYTFLAFANFTYNIDTGFPIQTFPSSRDIVDSGITSGLFVVEVQSNWGGNTTGICRVRLHGVKST